MSNGDALLALGGAIDRMGYRESRHESCDVNMVFLGDDSWIVFLCGDVEVARVPYKGLSYSTDLAYALIDVLRSAANKYFAQRSAGG